MPPKKAAPPPEEEKKKVEKKVIPEDFFYDKLPTREVHPLRIEDDFMSVNYSLGFETKRNNIHLLDDMTLFTSHGNYAMIVKPGETEDSPWQQQYICGRDGGGIGAVTVHPTKQYIVVGEKGEMPNVYIYEYPSMKLYRMLREGTERAYSCFMFSDDGEMLASVGSAPDYMLTVWNWKQESIILRTKAFAQEIFTVKFSPHFDGVLTTSGIGHIRFWKMAQTFTGLKLKGDIGKFGHVELSDIAGFAELPDGKVLSGSESGNLLLWDGNFVKMEITQKDYSPCHEGGIEEVFLETVTDEEGNEKRQFVTGGADGCVKMWDFSTIDLAETAEGMMHFEMEPLAVKKIGDGVKIKRILRSENHWMIHDDNGGIWRTEYPSFESKSLISFHAGAIAGMDTSPVDHFAASVGVDGTVRLWDIVSKKQAFMEQFSSAGTCLLWPDTKLDENGLTIVAGFADGVVRVLERMADGFALKSVMKPHMKNVNCMAFSSDYTHFATGGNDKTVFFFQVDGWRPIGFTEFDAPIVSICWGPEDRPRAVLVTTEDTNVYELTAPVLAEVDNSVSYLVDTDRKQFNFERPYIEPEKGSDDEEEAEEKKEGEEGEEGEEGVEKEAEIAPEPEEEEEEEEEEPRGPTISYTCMFVENNFYVTKEAPDGDYFWECTMDSNEPVQWFKTHTPEASVRFVDFSRSKSFLLSGTDSGVVQVRRADDLHQFWQLSLHSAGGVSAVRTSFDDRYLITSGHDGNLFVLDVHEENLPEKLPKEVPLVKKEEAEIPQIEDIVDENTYSIQQDKLQSEEDRRLADAEAKKQIVRKQLEEIRQDFQDLLKENFARPEPQQVPRDEFEVDPELREILENDGKEKVEEARKELEWISEKKKLGLSKLKKRFLDDVEVELISLGAFESGRCVRSFRTACLSDELQGAITQVHDLIKQEQENRKKAEKLAEQEDESDEKGDSGSPGEAANDGEGDATTLNNAALSKAEEKKRQRAIRAKQWEVLLAKKPDDKYEDPRDVAAIAWAEKNMGDYKLKMADDYVVPENQRVNAEKKRRQMILLEESVHSIKMGYNERFLALRELKKRIIENTAKDNQRVREINRQLKIDEELYEPVLQDIEYPEKREEFTQDELLSFEKDQIRMGAAAGSKSGGGMGNVGGGGGRRSDAGDDTVDASATGGQAATGASGSNEASQIEVAKLDEPDVPLSEMETAEKQAHERRLRFEKEKIIEKIKKSVQTFDEAVDDLRRERFKLEADLKTTDMKMLILYKEWRLLKEFEKKDNVLAKKLETKRTEKADIVAKIQDCNEKLVVKKADIEKVLEKDKKIFEEFNSVSADSKHADYLLKVFKKKIKRAKKKVKPEGEEEDSDEESEESESDYDSDDDDEEEEEEVCPKDCPQELWDKVLELREQRLDQEEFLQEFQKALELLKKDNDALVKKEKTIDTGLKTIEKDIQDFQNEKQRKLNELDVVVTLKMDQIQCLVDDRLPDDLGNAIVFTNGGLFKLKNRIKELEKEKSALRRQQRELRREHVQLSKAKKAKMQKVAELEAKALDVQMLKFGQVINLESLEQMSVNKTAEELKAKLREQEKKCAAELEQWRQKIVQANAQLARCTAENTEKLEKVADLSNAQYRLEAALNSTTTNVVSDSTPSQQREAEERNRLTQLVKLQAKEIDALKAEINMLRRKGGHIYTPSVTRNSNH